MLLPQHGARAEYYQFYDTETGLVESCSNPISQSERGAGPQAAAFLIRQGVDKVVAGRFGTKFRAELEDGGIVCIEKTGTVPEVVAQLSEFA